MQRYRRKRAESGGIAAQLLGAPDEDFGIELKDVHGDLDATITVTVPSMCDVVAESRSHQLFHTALSKIGRALFYHGAHGYHGC